MYFMGPVMQFDVGALEPTLAPMRPSSPPVASKEVKAIQREILPKQARPKPEPPPPNLSPPIEQGPVVQEAEVSIPIPAAQTEVTVPPPTPGQ